MNLLAGWSDFGLPAALWADLGLRLRAEFARRALRSGAGAQSLVAWGQTYLPQHFRRQPSAMHAWLAELLDAAAHHRGTKINVVGPRGGAKSTLVTLAYVLRAALEGWEPYIWIVSDTRHQAQTHL